MAKRADDDVTARLEAGCFGTLGKTLMANAGNQSQHGTSASCAGSKCSNGSSGRGAFRPVHLALPPACCWGLTLLLAWLGLPWDAALRGGMLILVCTMMEVCWTVHAPARRVLVRLAQLACASTIVPVLQPPGVTHLLPVSWGPGSPEMQMQVSLIVLMAVYGLMLVTQIVQMDDPTCPACSPDEEDDSQLARRTRRFVRQARRAAATSHAALRWCSVPLKWAAALALVLCAARLAAPPSTAANLSLPSWWGSEPFSSTPTHDRAAIVPPADTITPMSPIAWEDRYYDYGPSLLPSEYPEPYEPYRPDLRAHRDSGCDGLCDQSHLPADDDAFHPVLSLREELMRQGAAIWGPEVEVAVDPGFAMDRDSNINELVESTLEDAYTADASRDAHGVDTELLTVSSVEASVTRQLAQQYTQYMAAEAHADMLRMALRSHALAALLWLPLLLQPLLAWIASHAVVVQAFMPMLRALGLGISHGVRGHGGCKCCGKGCKGCTSDGDDKCSGKDCKCCSKGSRGGSSNDTYCGGDCKCCGKACKGKDCTCSCCHPSMSSLLLNERCRCYPTHILAADAISMQAVLWLSILIAHGTPAAAYTLQLQLLALVLVAAIALPCTAFYFWSVAHQHEVAAAASRSQPVLAAPASVSHSGMYAADDGLLKQPLDQAQCTMYDGSGAVQYCTLPDGPAPASAHTLTIPPAAASAPAPTTAAAELPAFHWASLFSIRGQRVLWLGLATACAWALVMAAPLAWVVAATGPDTSELGLPPSSDNNITQHAAARWTWSALPALTLWHMTVGEACTPDVLQAVMWLGLLSLAVLAVLAVAEGVAVLVKRMRSSSQQGVESVDEEQGAGKVVGHCHCHCHCHCCEHCTCKDCDCCQKCSCGKGCTCEDCTCGKDCACADCDCGKDCTCDDCACCKGACTQDCVCTDCCCKKSPEAAPHAWPSMHKRAESAATTCTYALALLLAVPLVVGALGAVALALAAYGHPGAAEAATLACEALRAAVLMTLLKGQVAAAVGLTVAAGPAA